MPDADCKRPFPTVYPFINTRLHRGSVVVAAIRSAAYSSGRAPRRNCGFYERLSIYPYGSSSANLLVAGDRLAAAAQSQGHLVTTTPEVLFVCVHNAGRSQMAAALLDHHAAGRVHVRSAGSTPAHEINPAVTEVMNEVGLDLSKEFPKPLTDGLVRAADVVITMGCGDACTVYPGKRYLDWDLPDPAGLPADQVRRIRDDIDRRVRALLAVLFS